MCRKVVICLTRQSPGQINGGREDRERVNGRRRDFSKAIESTDREMHINRQELQYEE
jgi:hypothetical protein